MKMIDANSNLFRSAQALGFAIIKELDKMEAVQLAGHGMLFWDSPADQAEHDERVAYLAEQMHKMHCLAMYAATTNALSILNAQQRTDRVASMVRYYALMYPSSLISHYKNRAKSSGLPHCHQQTGVMASFARARAERLPA